MLKVMHVINRLDRGGVEVWLVNLLRAAEPHRLQFTFCCLSDQPGSLDSDVQAMGAKIIRCPRNQSLWKFRRQLTRHMTSEDFDVVHSHVRFFSGIVLQIAAQAKIRVRIAHSHSTDSGYSATNTFHKTCRKLYSKLMRYLISRYATHGVGVSGPAARSLFGNLNSMTIPCFHIPAAMDMDQFRHDQLRSQDDLRQELGIGSDSEVIGHVGNLRYPKNHRFLFQIFARLLTMRPSAVLVLAGSGPDESALREQASELGISEQVIFAGSRDDVPSLMVNLFDVFIFPSHYEGLGLVAVEAQCAALPIIMSEGIPSESEVIGELITRCSLDDSPEVWARAALRALQRIYPTMEQTQPRIASCRFAIKQNLALLEDVYAGQMTERTREAAWSH